MDIGVYHRKSIKIRLLQVRCRPLVVSLHNMLFYVRWWYFLVAELIGGWC